MVNVHFCKRGGCGHVKSISETLKNIRAVAIPSSGMFFGGSPFVPLEN